MSLYHIVAGLLVLGIAVLFIWFGALDARDAAMSRPNEKREGWWE